MPEDGGRLRLQQAQEGLPCVSATQKGSYVFLSLCIYLYKLYISRSSVARSIIKKKKYPGLLAASNNHKVGVCVDLYFFPAASLAAFFAAIFF